MTKNIKKLTSL